MSAPAGSHDPRRLHVYDCECVWECVCVQCQPDLLTQVTPSMSLDWHAVGRMNDGSHAFGAPERCQLLLELIKAAFSAQVEAPDAGNLGWIRNRIYSTFESDHLFT